CCNMILHPTKNHDLHKKIVAAIATTLLKIHPKNMLKGNGLLVISMLVLIRMSEIEVHFHIVLKCHFGFSILDDVLSFVVLLSLKPNFLLLDLAKNGSLLDNKEASDAACAITILTKNNHLFFSAPDTRTITIGSNYILQMSEVA
ncbi:hypothetical protein ACJX0J_035892, partial [Zea mays]